ncbi:ferredoxin reductase [Nocardia sp. alder85J]|uniref:ferredoxin reductase n=1 Tax=Nocardia sp. alder85J TaxID=2862949 RepID=UPI001CD506D6|nr:FAD-binding oxidoreductase [Nocardia sp. alder85J]MCX4098129.1 FAD-binding oxidoreductase [Nocardia sp. alder85J]
MVGLVDLVQTLTTPHPLDRYLELIRPSLTVRDLRAEIVRVRHDANGSVTLRLRPTRRWAGHRAGQYVSVSVVIDGVKHTRCYSPVTVEGAGRELELTVRAHPDGLVSRHLWRNARAGMVLDLTPAAGTFVLPSPRPERIVLISGGSGITPVLSMLRTLAAEDHRGDVLFLHYARSPESVPHRVELDAVARAHPRMRIEFRYPGAESDRHFDRDTLTELAPWFPAAQLYVCGPARLMTAVRAVAAAEGIESSVHTEEFTLSNAAVDPAEVSGATSFSASGVRSENTGISLLEQAESAGLTPEYGCRMGICFSCTAIRRSGCTRNLRTGELDSDPDQRVQLCVNAAVGDVDIAL